MDSGLGPAVIMFALLAVFGLVAQVISIIITVGSRRRRGR